MDINIAARDFCVNNQIVSSVVYFIVGTVALLMSISFIRKNPDKTDKILSIASFVLSILLFAYAGVSIALRENMAFCSILL